MALACEPPGVIALNGSSWPDGTERTRSGLGSRRPHLRQGLVGPGTGLGRSEGSAGLRASETGATYLASEFQPLLVGGVVAGQSGGLPGNGQEDVPDDLRCTVDSQRCRGR